jgi:sporulation protein YlmC with PRC-barrel domain
MLLSAKRLQGERVRARDGDAGRIDDVYFDDDDWSVRHLVVRDDLRIPEREHLIPPQAVLGPAPGERLTLALDRSDIDRCPGADTDPPISYQFDAGRVAFYGDSTFLTWGTRAAGNPHLRAASIVIGYGVRAQDGLLGHVADLLIESEGWGVKALVVAPRWLAGKPILVDAKSVQAILWAERCIHLDLTKEQLRSARHSFTAGALQ